MRQNEDLSNDLVENLKQSCSLHSPQFFFVSIPIKPRTMGPIYMTLYSCYTVTEMDFSKK